jgi:hypothetical protein
LVSGDINSNTTWTADTVKITGDLNVAQGIVLTVNPGTYIESQGYFRINVSGRIMAIGTQTDTIVFTVHDTTNFWNDTTSVSGGWAGIKIVSNEASIDTSIFEFCKVQYAKKYDVYAGDIKGGAIFATDYGSLIIRNSLLNSNMVICYTYGVNGPTGGAVYCKNVNIVIIENNRFDRNRSFDNGGAIHIGDQCQTIITNNIFTNNKAIYWKLIPGYLVIGGAGAAIATTDFSGFSPTISNNYFFNNQTINGVIYTSNLNGFIFNNLICNNYGTGITDGHQLSSTRIYNNTIVNNCTDGGGIQLFSAAKVYNNICWGNEHLFFPGHEFDQINISQSMSGRKLFYNCVQFGDGGTNSTNEYPLFKHPSSGVGLAYNGSEADWSLADISPSVNSGTPDTSGLFIPEFDIIGNPRIYGVRIEMGCYENQSVVTGIDDDIVNAVHPIVYPNPGTDRLNIESAENEIIFELITLTGLTVIREQMDKGLNSVNTESLITGIYFYRLLNNKQQIVESGKWIKK